MNVSKDFEELFAFFNARKVRALIVGGFAVAFHAKPRFTKDIDLWIEPTPENATRLLAALADFGFGSLDLTVEDFIHPGRIVLGHDQPLQDHLHVELHPSPVTQAPGTAASGGSQPDHGHSVRLFKPANN